MDVLSTTEDLSAGPIVEKQEITAFMEDEQPIVHEKDIIPLVPNWNDHATDLKNHDVVAILQRPVIVSSGRLTPVFNFTPLAMPDAIITASANIRAKVAYFTYFRANVRVKVVFNATPFMSGKYLLWFSPYEGFSNRPIPNNLTCKTGYPCVELDIARGSSVELKIPFCSPLSHFDLVNAQGYMGKLHLDAITGTIEGVFPSLGAPYTMYAWFEDVQISMPNSKLPVTIPIPPLLEAQIFTEENSKIKNPSVSAVAGGFASTAKLFSGIIPRFSGFLKPVEWVSRAISSAASSVGLNKPQDISTSCAIYNIPGKGFTHMDGVDSGVPLAAAPDNALTMPSGLFATDVDEMDIGYVCKNACICTREIDWKTDTTVDTVLFSLPVSPGFCPTAGSEISPTVLGFVSSMFEKWTGALRYRIAVSKTAFHSGRLRITYHPAHFNPNLPPLVFENAYNWVLDLSVTSEMDFEIPYVSNTQWKDVALGDSTTLESVQFSTGMITISVLTELVVANAAASLSAPMYVWISAADDFSLAIPTNPRYVPLEFTPFSESELLEAQIWNETGKDSRVQQEETAPDVMFFPKAPIDSTLPEQLTIGEKIVSLRSVIKRFCKTAIGNSSPYPNLDRSDYSFPGPFPPTGSTLVTPYVSVDPAFFGTNGTPYSNSRSPFFVTKYFTDGETLTQGDAIAGYSFQSQALIHYLSYIYTFWTGSKRYKYFVGQNTTQFPSTSLLRNADGSPFLTEDSLNPRTRTQIPLRVYRDTQIFENGTIDSPFASTSTGNSADRVDSKFESIVFPDLDGVLEFTVPYYARTPISLIAQGDTNSTRGLLVSRNKIQISKGFSSDDVIAPYFRFSTPVATYPVFTGRTVEDIGAFCLYEAAGDDFSFGYLHGAPTLVNTRAF
jgi:hypothetical protein